ncbi:MAG: glycerol-3-phosphate dehydrogenase/oxidase [Phycisphaerales bacterium]|nr:glycerol-3-phosphate dehydrogenase/oxidase [Phycisphaerales bacterium]
MLSNLKSEPFDVLVIGGGATGLGCAVDAATRGYRTALVEGHDFAKGTSSRSTKLVHGGVRYLENLDFGLVAEALEERATMAANAPHIVHDLKFVVPRYQWWEGPFYGIGMKLYDALAGKRNLGSSRGLSREETILAIRGVQEEGLLGGIEYHDAQFDDARMAIALAKTAATAGAAVLNYTRVTELIRAEGRICGAIVRDEETGEMIRINASVVINATGVFADQVRAMDGTDHAGIEVEPARGAHLVFDRSFLPGNEAIMVPHTDDGRVLFVIPWHERALVGTTDVETKDLSLEPRASAEEIEFILRNAARYLSRAPTHADILSVFAGLRPLVRPKGAEQGSKKVSREHVVSVSASGMVTILGGKWTTYRRMAQDTVDMAIRVGALEPRECKTARVRVHGYEAEPKLEAGIGSSRALYGSDARHIASIESTLPELARPLHPRLQLTGSEVIFAANHEMARTLEDVLARRSRSLFLDARAAMEVAPDVAVLLGLELRWTPERMQSEIDAFLTVARGYLPQGIA